jgi:polysaccharide transporter, PST family
MLGGLRSSSLVHNAAALYAIQAAGFLLPLATLPYLARVLGPEAWGVVLFSQAFAIWLSLFVQYGFSFSGTRAVARHRDEPETLARTVAGVQGAKLMLLLGATLLALASWYLAPFFRAQPEFLFWAWLAAVLQGFSPLWYFQGVERLRGAAAVDVLAKVVATAGIFLFIRSPEHGWGVLALRATGELVATVVLTFWLYRGVPALRPRLAGSIAMLREGWSLFVFTGAASVYTAANSFILGLMALPREVGFFGAGERMVRAGSLLLGPVSQALYPRVSNLAVRDRERADALIRRSFLPFVGMGLALGGLLWIFAPWLTRVVLGPEYAPVATIIRILAFIPPLLGLGTVLGLQWALPMGHDRAYSRFVLFAGAVNVVLAVLLVPRFGALGMAVSAVVAEACVEAGLVWLLVRERGGFWRRDGGSPPSSSPITATQRVGPR